MESSEPRESRNCEALIDQTDFIDYQCTATDVASAWTSVLAYLFPPDEGYQLRLNHTETWVEVYVIRVASRPGERVVSFSPLFIVRCYGTRRDGPQMPLWPQIMAEIPSSVTRVCQSVDATGRPSFGAISCADLVRLCLFDSRDLHMEAWDVWPDIYFLSLWQNQIQNYLNHVKAEFEGRWEEPCVRYSADDIPSPSIKDEMSVVGDTRRDVEANNGGYLAGVDGADNATGTENTSSMETSSAGSTDLDTDSDISEILMMKGTSGAHEMHSANGVNDHVDIVMNPQEESRNRSGSSTNNQQVFHTNGFRVTIDYMVNRIV